MKRPVMPIRASGPPRATRRCGRRSRIDASAHTNAVTTLPSPDAMSIDYPSLVLPYVRPSELDRHGVAHRPVIVVGAGPVGLTVAIDLARYGTPVLLVD